MEKQSIAVVDDELDIRETLSFALDKGGYRPELYPDGIKAWDKFQHTGNLSGF